MSLIYIPPVVGTSHESRHKRAKKQARAVRASRAAHARVSGPGAAASRHPGSRTAAAAMFSGSVLLPGGDATGDCTLRTLDGGSFEAQRGFLSTVSPYFAAVFREQFGAQKDVVVSGVSAAVLDALLTFQYTDQVGNFPS